MIKRKHLHHNKQSCDHYRFFFCIYLLSLRLHQHFLGLSSLVWSNFIKYGLKSKYVSHKHYLNSSLYFIHRYNKLLVLNLFHHLGHDIDTGAHLSLKDLLVDIFLKLHSKVFWDCPLVYKSLPNWICGLSSIFAHLSL